MTQPKGNNFHQLLNSYFLNQPALLFMKTKLLFLFVFLLSLISSIRGQEKRYRSFFVETGMDFISCAPPDKDYIRGDVNPNPYYYEPSYMMALLYKNYIGVKAAIRLANNKLELAGGVRFTRMESSLGKNSYWSGRSDFLYLLFRQQGTVTDYLKIKEISQVTNYIGIPLELRIYPYAEHFIQLYYKVGTDFNVLVRKKTTVDFYVPAMQHYEEEVGRIVEDPWHFYSTVQLGIGLKIGKNSKPGINIEACVPVAILANYKSSFVTPEAGGGFQLNIRFPL
jgi:hypothetical protein